jgi:hypothetical protein
MRGLVGLGGTSNTVIFTAFDSSLVRAAGL